MTSSISIGMCTSVEKVTELAPGYDYLELAVSRALCPLQNDEWYAAQRATLSSLVPHVRAFNVFIPADIKLVGPSVDWDRVDAYVTSAVRRAGELGGQVIVFGSGGARRVPDGFSRALAWGQLVRFANLCADQADIHGVTIAIEPLNQSETNILNTYLEGVQLARDAGRDKVRVLADIYHFMMEGEPLEHIEAEPDWLAHVHLADTGRLFPGSGTYPLERLFALLKDIDYRGMASIECGWRGDYRDETLRALSFLRGLAE